MKTRAGDPYSLEKGASIYPVAPGTVLKILEPIERYNKQVGTRVNHTCFIWIQRHGTPNDRRYQRGRARCLFAFLPMGEIGRYEIYEQLLQTESLIRRHLCRPYEKVGTVSFRYNVKGCYTEFYELIGILPKVDKRKCLGGTLRNPTSDRPDLSIRR